MLGQVSPSVLPSRTARWGGGVHGLKYHMRRQGSDPPGRAQALLDDSSNQSSLWLLWASPKSLWAQNIPESHCPPGPGPIPQPHPFCSTAQPLGECQGAWRGPGLMLGLPSHQLPDKYLLSTFCVLCADGRESRSRFVSKALAHTDYALSKRSNAAPGYLPAGEGGSRETRG